MTAAARPGEGAPSVVLLGSQADGWRVGAALRELGVRRRVALVAAGYQEFESDDAPLVADLEAHGLECVNLRLHERSEEVFRIDGELAEASSARQERLRQLQGFYRTRLDYVGSCARAISTRHVDPEILEQEDRVSVEQLRQLDRDHLLRCRAVHDAFEARWKPRERAMVTRERRALRELLSPAEALVLGGGHVASLLNRLRLFGVLDLVPGRHVVAWSAGAMALTDRIVLFHDFPPQGTGFAEVLGDGFALAPGLVALPEPGRRIDPGDRAGIARFARRMAPATCLTLEGNARAVFRGGRLVAAQGGRLTPAGDIEPGWRAGAPLLQEAP